ncbi:MAG: octanoyltransferase [Candidatus Marinimicrobia bacterium]|nr:octanoyltransferase [Candidatus Neomarinimicrobiota bacterium]
MKQSLKLLDLDCREYREVWSLQKKMVQSRYRSLIPDTLILVEHYPVYTFGKNSNDNHLLGSRDNNIPIYHTERGGDVTFHGPGQLVGYPIIDLHNHQKSITWYMRSLEQVIINTLKLYKIIPQRRKGLTGVWVGDEKIAAFGVRLSRWVSMHGFALNVNTDLKFYDGIIPCGIFEYDVTSMAQILGHEMDMTKLKKVLINEFIKLFNFEISETCIA